MFYNKFALLIVLIFSLRILHNKAKEIKSFEIPPADDNLHIYGLPVRQGDAWIIQCPSCDAGLTILDMGSSDGPSKGFWNSFEIKTFLNKSFNLIKNVIITHNHADHYNILPNVLSNKTHLKNVSNIYISCTKNDLPEQVKNWTKKIDKWENVTTFNDGLQCGPNKVSCGKIDLCPKCPKFRKRPRNDNTTGKDSEDLSRFIQAEVLSANWGQCNKTQNKNTDSIVISLKVGQMRILMNGDFEDFNESENGPLKDLVNFYGEKLLTDIYHISHHGADLLANKDIILNATKPKAVMVSSNPFYTHRHPRCSIFDRLIKDRLLCKPKSCNRPGGYCCERNEENDKNVLQVNSKPSDKILQKNYICGEGTGLRNVTNNKYAIYSTVPTSTTLNVIEFFTDGWIWGFQNHFFPWTG